MKRIEQLCVVLAVVGLGMMYYASATIEAEHVWISEIDSNMIGESVKINGTVESSYFSDGTAILQVEDQTSSITVAIFDTEKSFIEGHEAYVTGSVTMYEGELEVVADEIIQK